MNKVFFCGLVSVALSGPLLAQPNISATPAQIEKIREAMEEGLRDAPSARFRNVVVVSQSPTMSIFCGDVNSKNAYGAYAGYAGFFGLMGKNESGDEVFHFMGTGVGQRAECDKAIREFRSGNR